MADKKILVIDDDPDIIEAVTMVLESEGYQTVVARDGEEGLRKLAAEKPDLLILDLLMPKKDGFAVYHDLKGPGWSEHRGMPIIIMTSVREEASKRRYELETGHALSPDDYLEKPISPELLIASVRRQLERKRSGVG